MEKVERPHVSVIALCFNTGHFVVEALESLVSQTYDNFEVVVVDDGSADDSVDRIQNWISQCSLQVRFIKKETNEGIPAALNTGIRESDGSIVTWLSDDLWDEDRLERVVTCFSEVPQDVGVVFGDAIVIDASGEEIGELRPPRSLSAVGVSPGAMATCDPGSWVILDPRFVGDSLLHRCFIPAPAAAVRRTCYDSIGSYDETLGIEDLDFWLRAVHATRFAYVRTPLVRYRKHAANFTSGGSTMYLEALEATLRKHQSTYPGQRATIVRHVREEAYRVISGLLVAGRLRLALITVRRFYLPNLQPTTRCVKETARLVAGVGSAMIRITFQRQERQG